jgi:hypothetical protein
VFEAPRRAFGQVLKVGKGELFDSDGGRARFDVVVESMFKLCTKEQNSNE